MKEIILFLTPLMHSLSVQDIIKPKEYELEENMRLAKEAVKSSPYIDMASYSISAIVVFTLLVIAVLFLIMFLKR
ncbi:MAG: hypothetical protein PQ612_09940 [Rickettsiales bacterium]|nr:hypothetical protein [Pseudomonadota bacterium]MDA0967159.1 hypothetical protein [Pseudomonadota bacterium]MDG4544344.1 hypothetical protein [Rickettsiales bacterium]MDG4546474.1 hypothetical protein [Rickettsiales bacterium]MDG4548620.1 hypothetical protein [Rickettsiales bacterium]